jgi:hypothetical protein
MVRHVEAHNQSCHRSGIYTYIADGEFENARPRDSEIDTTAPQSSFHNAIVGNLLPLCHVLYYQPFER